jgi:GT2 family glycosyltransferase
VTEKLSPARVAAIVVNFRTPELTIACVESLLAGTEPVRVIVVDNASNDDSATRIDAHFRSDSRVSVVVREVNDGYSGGNNAGVALARTMDVQFALILNSDTVLDPSCVQLLADEAERDPRTALVTPRIFLGDQPDVLWFGGGRYSSWHGRPIHIGVNRAASEGWTDRRDLSFASGCALLVRLDAFAGDLFDASLFSYAEDLDLSLRARRGRFRIRYVPDALVWHHEGSSHRKSGGQALRFYLNTRNVLRVSARYARWYHWITLGPSLAVDLVGRLAAVAIRDRDARSLGAVARGVVHAVIGRSGAWQPPR